MLWQGLGAHVQGLLSSAQIDALIVAPFIKQDALRALFDATSASVSIVVYTRWRAEEVAAGVSDLEILDLARARGASLRLVDDLHAKVYAVDGVRALIGSANVTHAGLGTGPRPNLEVLQMVQLAHGELEGFRLELERRSRDASAEEADRVRSEAVLIASPYLLSSESQLRAVVPSRWFPQFRSPDRIYQIVTRCDLAEFPATLRHDLSAMSLSLVGDERTINERIRRQLRRSTIVEELDRFLSEPRRFGELTTWLQAVLPDSTHEYRQEVVQTLIRWLLYFDPERYVLETPNYTEVLMLRGSGAS